MPYDPQKHHRRSIRLKGYDYARPGAYFVTICVQHRELLLEPEAVRAMIQKWWGKLPGKFPCAETDAFVIMPNHIHGLVVIVGADLRVGPDETGQTQKARQTHGFAPTETTGPGEHRSSPLPTIIQWVKTMTTNEYIRGVKQLGWASFPGKLWQRNYWEHIIRDEVDLARIREYIQNNPARWAEDSLHPSAPPFPGETP